MPLKKPSDFYDKNPNSSFDNVKEELKNAKPEKVEKISEAFDSFKNNLNNIQALIDFVTSVDTFKAVSRTTADYSRGAGNKSISFTQDERRKSDK